MNDKCQDKCSLVPILVSLYTVHMRALFVVHEHHATNLHFDLRLEIDGVLKSWAVPKGVSMNPADRRLAIAVPDHSLSYADFEGTIPKGSYGAGEVRIWDKGQFEAENPSKQLEKGKLILKFYGRHLQGEFTLAKWWNYEKKWLIIKSKDVYADKDWELQTVLKSKK